MESRCYTSDMEHENLRGPSSDHNAAKFAWMKRGQRSSSPATRNSIALGLGYAFYILNSATPSHTNCTAIASSKNPKIRLIAPSAPGPSRFTIGPPRHRNK